MKTVVNLLFTLSLGMLFNQTVYALPNEDHSNLLPGTVIATDIESKEETKLQDTDVNNPIGNSIDANCKNDAAAIDKKEIIGSSVNNKASVKETEKKKQPFKLRGYLFLETQSNEVAKYNSNAADFPKFDPLRPDLNYVNSSQAKLDVCAEYKGDFDAICEWYYNSKNKAPELRDCYLRFYLSEDVTMRAGQFRTPFGHEGVQSSAKVLVVNPSKLTQALYLGRDLGIEFTLGDPKNISYNVALVGGQGTNKNDLNSSKDIFLRVNKKFDNNWKLGLSTQIGRFTPQGSPNDLPVFRFGADGVYKVDGLRIDLETAYGTGYNRISKKKSESYGAYAGSAIQIAPNLDLVLFADWFDPNLKEENEYRYDETTNAACRGVVGFDYYIDRKAPHRFMFNYEVHRPTEGFKVTRTGWFLRYAISF